MLKVRNEFVWLWWIAAIEPIDKIILGICISSFERTICLLLAERFLQELVVRKYGKHPVSTDGGVHGIHRLVILKITSPFSFAPYRKCIVERTIIQFVKDRTESFDDDIFHVERKAIVN